MKLKECIRHLPEKVIILLFIGIHRDERSYLVTYIHTVTI